MLTNRDLADAALDFLRQAQVRTVVVCAGARNAPLVMALEASGGESHFEIYSYFEERSAAFFALGLCRSQKTPVAILTTSGTAVAELLPAAVEATYQGLPLILITADRPRHYRGSGAPQAIDQIGLFSRYVEKYFDWDVHTDQFSVDWSGLAPVHLNLCFDEPLIDQPGPSRLPVSYKLPPANGTIESRKALVPGTQVGQIDPLVLIGGLPDEACKAVAEFILERRLMVYAESISQLRADERLRPYLLSSADVWAGQAFKNLWFKSVIRIGGVPTLRFWRDLENQGLNIPVVNFTDVPFSGLARKSEMHSLSSLRQLNVQMNSEVAEKVRRLDSEIKKEKVQLLQSYSQSEAALTFQLSQIVGEQPIYLGNSLPIRNWDQFTEGMSAAVYANRGANGIDGQISTYLGWSTKWEESYCFVGDLTALYDLAALGLANSLPKARRTLVIMNNGGGQIFQRVFKNEKFINAHQLDFAHFAALWSWDYQSITDLSTILPAAKNQHRLIELKPDPEQSKKFWSEWDELCRRQ
jgi:2-succinyl-5-enolpyruvyl-6-hydroxy-3-cyclohexene-1-carboxylate synthase